jgi:hypothetical protein
VDPVDPMDLRVSDAERQAVADRLQSALNEGRLELVEYDERLQGAYQAKTYRELEALTADLPGPATPAKSQLAPAAHATTGVEAPRPGPARRRRSSVPPIAFALILLAGLGLVVTLASHGQVFFWPLFPLGFWGLFILRGASRHR